MEHRRNFLISLAVGGGLLGCATQEPAPVVQIDPRRVNNLSDLIREIKNAAGDRMPKNVKIEDIYKTLADAFVEYAHDAIALGIPIPEELKRRLPPRKRVIVPAMMIFTLWGIKFIIPISTFFTAILSSLAIMFGFIVAAIGAVVGSSTKT